MVGHVNLEEQVDADFSRTRRSGALRRAGTRLRGDNASDGLPCLGGVRELPGAVGAGLSRHEDGGGGADAAVNRREAQRAYEYQRTSRYRGAEDARKRECP